MKSAENVTATSQLIRFIRGDVKCEEFYDSQSQDKQESKKLIIITIIICFFVSLSLFGGIYFFFSHQNEQYQSQLNILLKDLEHYKTNSSFKDIEKKELFLSQQRALHENLLQDKFFFSCLLKELTHLIPSNIFFNKIFLSNDVNQEHENQNYRQKLLLHGMMVKKEKNLSDSITELLKKINQSSFFEEVQVTYQNEFDSYDDLKVNFTLTCFLAQ